MKHVVIAGAILLFAGAARADFSVVVNNANGLNEICALRAQEIFSSTVTDWSLVDDSGLTGPIFAVALASTTIPTQDFFLATGMTAFGPSVNVVRGLAAPMIVAVLVANNPSAIAVNDPTALRPGSKALTFDY